MSSPIRTLTIAGTRPEIIKVAPVLRELENHPLEFDSRLLVVEQQSDILHQAVQEWELTPWKQVQLTGQRRSLVDSLSVALPLIHDLIQEAQPDWVIVQGDTLTTLAGSMAAGFAKVNVAHIEAGLRSFDRENPFPEEINRELIDRIAAVRYAPTPASAQNLLRENLDPDTVIVVGNTVVDAMRMTLGHDPAASVSAHPPKHMLVSAHRRENFGEGIRNLCHGIRQLLDLWPELSVTYVTHPNPNARLPAEEILGQVARVELIPPQGYRSFLKLLAKTDLVLTDSGGVQEEAPYFGKPVLVARERTERGEAAEQGNAEMVGTDTARIVSAASALMSDPVLYRQRATPLQPYGDGRAAERIRQDLLQRTQK
jgi:UDP-N-acetylglucosamine 2-epimerase (non-hydrolysing)